MMHATDLIKNTRLEYAEFTQGLTDNVEKETVITRALANRIIELQDHIEFLIQKLKNQVK